MKKSILLAALVTCLLSANLDAQEYYEIYPSATTEVQNKMNENKISGIEILTDISAHHIIGLVGVSTSAKSQLESLLNTNEKIISSTVSADVTSLTMDTSATLTNAEILLILDEVNGIVTGHTIEYTAE